jgi:hypothetical protein
LTARGFWPDTLTALDTPPQFEAEETRMLHTDKPTSDPVRAVLIRPDGALEVVDVHPDPAAIADIVEAAAKDAVTPRATWQVKGGDVVTIWQRTEPEASANELAIRVVDELLPPTSPGVPDRIRDAMTIVPISGKALITGYRPRRGTHPGATVPVTDLTLDLIRAALDGRKARREQNAVDTEALQQLTPATDAMPVQEAEAEAVSHVAVLADVMKTDAGLPRRPPAKKTRPR